MLALLDGPTIGDVAVGSVVNLSNGERFTAVKGHGAEHDERRLEVIPRQHHDRIDLLVTVPRPRALELESRAGEASEHVRRRVEAARERARGEPLRRSKEASGLLSRAVERLPLSARGRARVARVARTAALLAGAEEVGGEHVAEALSFRSPTELGTR